MMLRVEDNTHATPIAVIPPARFAAEMGELRHYELQAEWDAITAVQAKLNAGEHLTRADTHPLGISVRYLSDAEGIAERAREWFRTRAEIETGHSHDPGDPWDGRETFIEILHTGNAVVVGMNEVWALLPAPSHWAYLAANALDYAGQFLPDTALIRQITTIGEPIPGRDLHAHALTW
ncbi:hypothetical protein [Nocardia yamanashiensis]|uniref:hypothetical protein n=1 Tax=Nocardia yamanashiensis TaxID=209247 RepID=UPI00082BAEA2|nr:hypothetical protein [Nocardia yamanashiensis]